MALSTRERLAMVMDDCTDAAKLDGMPLTGATIGKISGEHLAMMKAIAASCLELEKRIASLERRVESLRTVTSLMDRP